MVAATGEYVWMVRGDGSIQQVASFSDGGETQVAVSVSSLAVEHGSWLALFDRSGNKAWERQASPDKSLGGILSDGSLIVDDPSASTTEKIGANSEQVIATGTTTRWISDDWVLTESIATDGNPTYQWVRPATGELAPLPAGWVYESADVFIRDPGVVALFHPGEGLPHAALSLVEEAAITTFNFTDGGGDLLFGAYYSSSDSSADFVWRVPRDLSAASKIQLGGKIALPTIDQTGTLFGIEQAGDGFQPAWSVNGGASFSTIGSQVPSEFGGMVSVRGKSAAIAVGEGHTYVEPPYVQIFHDHQTDPQTLRASQHFFTEFSLSPDGQCAAYYEQDANTWQLVIRDLSNRSEVRPGSPVNEDSGEALRILWWAP
jgi:hypothetical protein